MRTKERKSGWIQQFEKRKALYTTVFVSLVLGLLIGIVFALTLSGDALNGTTEYMSRFFSAYSLQSVNKSEVFQIALYHNFKSLLFFWLSGLSLFLFPFALAQMGIKGFKIGFAVTFLAKIYRWKGTLFSIVAMLPQNLIILPLFILYSVSVISRAGKLYQLRQKSNGKLEKKRLYLTGLKVTVIMSVLMVLCSVLEGYFIPVVVRPICSSML